MESLIENELLRLGLVLGAGVLAGALNVLAGGGSLLTLPILLFLGLPASVANGTNRLGIIVQNVVAAEAFRRQQLSDPTTALKLAVWTLPGAVAGALLSLEIPDIWFKRILAVIVVAGALTIAFPRAPAATAHDLRPLRLRWPTALAFLGIGLYGGFIQAGVGMVFLLVLYHALRLDLVLVNVYKVFVIAVYTIPALIVFVLTDNMAWGLGAVLAVGFGVGGIVGSRITVRGEDRVIRLVVGVALLLMAVRLAIA